MAELNITTNDFRKEVLESPIPVLVDFWATWCGPCRMMSPVIEELAAEYKGKVKVCKVNVDQEPALAAHYQITSIPAVMLFDKGNIKQVSIGFKPKAALETMLK